MKLCTIMNEKYRITNKNDNSYSFKQFNSLSLGLSHMHIECVHFS